MAANDLDRTGTYDSSEDSQTGTYDSSTGASETYSYTELRDREFKSRTHGIGNGDRLTLRGQEYTIVGIISEGTGEAVVYKIEDADGSVFALKLYFEFANPKEEPNHDTLSEILKIDDPDILKLYDFGAKHPEEKFRGTYCYEISQFAVGGDLFSVKDFAAKYTPQFIEETIVQELFRGITNLHHRKIYHCDLKPANIFYVDKEQTDIVIGDYGSGKYFGVSADSDKLNQDREIRKTSTVKGTEVYLSPEQSRGIVSEKNDFYGFGMILLHLLYPEWICEGSDVRKVDKEKFERITEHQFDSKPLIHFDPNLGRLNSLIEGLTLVNNKNRWGASEVEKWLNGEEVPIRYAASESASIQPVKLGFADIREIRTAKDLIQVIETRSEWYEELIEDDATFASVQLWLDSYRDIPTRKEVVRLVGYYQPYGKDFVRDALVRYFEPARPVRIDMDSLDVFSSTDLKKEVESFFGKIDEIWKITKLETIRFYLYQLEFSLRQRENTSDDLGRLVVASIIEKIYATLGIPQESSWQYATEAFKKIAPDNEQATYRLLVDMFYAFDPQRKFKDKGNNPIATLPEMALLYVQDEGAFADKYLKVEREKALLQFGRSDLERLDRTSFVFEIFKDHAEAEIELLDVTFDRKRNFLVSYQYYKSLNAYLTKQRISGDFTLKSRRNEIYSHRKGLAESFEAEANNFIKTISREHNIRTLAPSVVAQIKAEFIRQARERRAFLWYERLLFWRRPPKNATVENLSQQLKASASKLHLLPAFLTGAAFAVLFLIAYPLFALYMGWIVWDTSTRYITFNKPVLLDAKSYAPGDTAKITSENEFFTCLDDNSTEKCFPTQNLLNLKLDKQTTSAEQLGKVDYEFKTPRDVFKASDDFWITHKGRRNQFHAGDVITIRIQKSQNNKDSYCFDFGKRGTECVPSDNKFVDNNGKPNGRTMSDYGTAIKDYRGRRLFTFSRSVTLDGVTYPAGSSWEESTSASPWITCISANGRKCFPKQSAIDRLRQPNVPVMTNFGTISSRQTDFSIKTAFILMMVLGSITFIVAIPLARIRDSFILRGQLGTAKFRDMGGKMS